MNTINRTILRFFYQDTAAEAYKKALPAKLKIFEDFMGDKSFPVGEKVILWDQSKILVPLVV